VELFQTYYLNLIRWVSQGRLLRDSSLGMLLLDRDHYWVGDQVAVRALLNDAAGNPLTAASVDATVMRPDGIAETVVLRAGGNAAHAGSFSGQFTATAEGRYAIRLPVPGASADEVLRDEVEAGIPDLEKLRPARNDELLLEMADRTGGILFAALDRDGTAFRTTSVPAVADADTRPRVRLSDRATLAELVQSADQTTWIPGVPDVRFAEVLARWLTGWLVLVFCAEWVLRRCYRLA
jgi:hypothetical protein